MVRDTLTLAHGGTAAVLVSALEDARVRTMRFVDRLTADDLERGDPNSISSVLYHVAAIEADWLFDDIRGEPEAIPADLFPLDVREEDGRLTPVSGQSLEDHLERLERVRGELLSTIRSMTEDDLHTPRTRTNYDVSPAYVIHHLMQHEAEHRAELGRALRIPSERA